MHAESGATTIHVTHDQIEALTMSDRVADFVGNPMIKLLLLVRLGESTVLVHAPKDLRAAPGGEVRLTVAPHRVNVFDPSTEQAVPFRPEREAP